MQDQLTKHCIEFKTAQKQVHQLNYERGAKKNAL